VRIGVAWGILGVLVVGAGIGLKLSGDAALDLVREHTALLEVRRVDPGDTRWIPPWEVVDASGVTPGDDLLVLSPQQVAERIAHHPRVAQARVTRTWRRTVRVAIEEKPPLALWVGRQSQEVAEDGTVLGSPPAGVRPEWPPPSGESSTPRGVELPLLTGVRAGLAPGEILEHDGARNALAFLSRLRAYGAAGEDWISEIWAGEPDQMVLVTLQGGIPVRIGDGRLSRRKLRALQAILDRLRRDAEPVAFVDARFRHQVVVKTS
jgi:cell division protein FtsQ